MLTREDTGAAKGLAICLMFVHHLYPFKERLLNGNTYIPTLVVYDIEHYLGGFAKLCVAIFLFLSGYGLYASSGKASSVFRYTCSKVIGFYKVYWSYFLVFVPIGFLFFSHVRMFGGGDLRYRPDWATVLLNAVAYSSSFNGEWWFAQLYLATLVLVFPLYRYLIDRNFLFLVSLVLLFHSLSTTFHFLENLLFWQTSFVSGMIAAKFGPRHEAPPAEFTVSDFLHALICCGLCVLIRVRVGGSSLDFLLAPVFILASNRLARYLKLFSIFEYMGRYSFPMWLNHSFFCYYFFQDIVYFPRYAPLVFLTLLFLSLSCAVGIEKARAVLGEWVSVKMRGA